MRRIDPSPCRHAHAAPVPTSSCRPPDQVPGVPGISLGTVAVAEEVSRDLRGVRQGKRPVYPLRDPPGVARDAVKGRSTGERRHQS